MLAPCHTTEMAYRNGSRHGMIPEVIKNPNARHRRKIHFFHIEGCHQGLLILAHGSGRQKNDPDNYYGINLLKVFFELLCRAANTRLFKWLETIEPTMKLELRQRQVTEKTHVF